MAVTKYGTWARQTTLYSMPVHHAGCHETQTVLHRLHCTACQCTMRVVTSKTVLHSLHCTACQCTMPVVTSKTVLHRLHCTACQCTMRVVTRHRHFFTDYTVQRASAPCGLSRDTDSSSQTTLYSVPVHYAACHETPHFTITLNLSLYNISDLTRGISRVIYTWASVSTASVRCRRVQATSDLLKNPTNGHWSSNLGWALDRGTKADRLNIWYVLTLHCIVGLYVFILCICFMSMLKMILMTSKLTWRNWRWLCCVSQHNTSQDNLHDRLMILMSFWSNLLDYIYAKTYFNTKKPGKVIAKSAAFFASQCSAQALTACTSLTLKTASCCVNILLKHHKIPTYLLL